MLTNEDIVRLYGFVPARVPVQARQRGAQAASEGAYGRELFRSPVIFDKMLVKITVRDGLHNDSDVSLVRVGAVHELSIMCVGEEDSDETV